MTNPKSFILRIESLRKQAARYGIKTKAGYSALHCCDRAEKYLNEGCLNLAEHFIKLSAKSLEKPLDK